MQKALSKTYMPTYTHIFHTFYNILFKSPCMESPLRLGLKILDCDITESVYYIQIQSNTHGKSMKHIILLAMGRIVSNIFL